MIHTESEFPQLELPNSEDLVENKLPNELIDKILALTSDSSASEIPLLFIFTRFLNVFRQLKSVCFLCPPPAM